MQRLIEYLSTWMVEEESIDKGSSSEIDKAIDLKSNKLGASIVHRKAVVLLKDKLGRNGIVRFPDVFHVLSWFLHLNRDESWLFLRELEQVGFVTIVPYHGIRLKFN